MNRMEGLVAIVTGGGNGIGRGCALQMAREGGKVVVADVAGDRAEEVHQEIQAAGGVSIARPVDVSDVDQVEALVADTLSEFGQVDALVNTAALRRRGRLMEMTDDQDWHQVIAVDLTGSMYISRAVARPMMERKSGTILLFASDRGLFGQETGANYAAAKAGVIALAKSLALELGPHNVTVNAMNPGTTPTPRPHENEAAQAHVEELRKKRAADDPLGRLSTVEDLAEYVTWIASTGGKFLTGQLITNRVRKG